MTNALSFSTLSPEMVRSNIDALIAVAADVPGEYWTEENFLVDLPKKWVLSFGVWRQSGLIGYAILSERCPQQIHLHHFMISAAERGHGHGAHMVAEMVDRCRASQARLLTLKTPMDNHGAIRFYKRYGFSETDEQGSFVVMARSLG